MLKYSIYLNSYNLFVKIKVFPILYSLPTPDVKCYSTSFVDAFDISRICHAGKPGPNEIVYKLFQVW